MGTQIKTDLIFQLNTKKNSSKELDELLNEIQNSINEHNLQRMIEWEGNHNSDMTLRDKKIKELQNKKTLVLKVINNAGALETVQSTTNLSDNKFDA